MAHETHQDINHPENKPAVSFTASFWFVIILVGLFIAAVNFVNMSGHEEGTEKTETTANGEHKEAAASHTMAEEKSENKTAADTAHSSEPVEKH